MGDAVRSGLWIDAAGRALYIEERATAFRVTVARTVDGPCFRRSSLCSPFATTRALRAKLRDGVLVVEAGTPGLGPTYELTKVEELLIPTVRMGLYDDFDEDLGVPWAFPISPYRRATPEEVGRFAGVFPVHFRIA